MTEEEEKTVKTLYLVYDNLEYTEKGWKDFCIKNKNELLEADKIITSQEAILNLIEKLQEENEQLKNAVQ